MTAHTNQSTSSLALVRGGGCIRVHPTLTLPRTPALTRTPISYSVQRFPYSHDQSDT